MNGRPVDWDAYAAILGTDTDGGIARRGPARGFTGAVSPAALRALQTADTLTPYAATSSAVGRERSAPASGRRLYEGMPRAGPRRGEWKRAARRAAKLAPPVVEVEEPAWRPFDPDAEPDPRWVARFDRRATVEDGEP